MSLPCPPDRWPRFSELLDALMALPMPSAMPGWLRCRSLMPICVQPWQRYAAACPGRDGHSFLSGSPVCLLPAGRSHQPGQHIGPTSCCELGQGGMGVVWLARRADGAPTPEVALKPAAPTCWWARCETL